MGFIAMATTSVCQWKGNAGALRFLRTVLQPNAEHRALQPRFNKTHYTYSRPQNSQLSTLSSDSSTGKGSSVASL